jgi:hypothetical protein
MPSWAIYGNERRRGIPAPSGIQTPDEIFGGDLWAWFDAGVGVTLSGSDVTTWDDQSGNNRDVSWQSVPGILFSATGANGEPAIDFVATANATLRGIGAGYSMAGVTQLSVFAVLSMESPTEAFGSVLGYRDDESSAIGDAGCKNIMGRWDSNNEIYTFGGEGIAPVSLSTLYHVAIIGDGTNDNETYVNNSLVDTGTGDLSLAGAGPNPEITIGTDLVGNAWDGKVAEVVYVVGAVPSSGQRAALHAYFADKYSL